MARSLASKPNVVAPGGSYPYGRIRDNDGTGNGTPVNELVYGDFHQFFAKLMDYTGAGFNGLPDNQTNGFQYIEGLKDFISKWMGDPNVSLDLDDMNKPSLYIIDGSNFSNIPAGFTGYGQLIITTSVPATIIWQRVVSMGNGAEWVRIYSSGTWGAWALIKLASEVLSIGDWNMSVTSGGGISNKPITHGITSGASNIRSIKVLVRDDNGVLFDLCSTVQLSAPGPNGGIDSIGNSSLSLRIVAGGYFDSANFDQTSYNRGWVTIDYVPQ